MISRVGYTIKEIAPVKERDYHCAKHKDRIHCDHETSNEDNHDGSEQVIHNVCCWCGKEYAYKITYNLPEPPKHGEYKPTVSFLDYLTDLAIKK